ncbi:MAG TPA: hypothetical protein P5234_11425 [Thermoanaerobaculaceae bacterium]|nr:hypothetical protein [Thermoanaerobaculaceae bacterium]HRS16841.1 hypothetical protein [Thermoanaerobaculaceae bacterium]
MNTERWIAASAPGKAVLLGEYAVLEGAPALVMAVPVRAVVKVRATGDRLCTLEAPDLGVRGQRFHFDRTRVRWVPRPAPPVAARLRVLGAVLSDQQLRAPGGVGSCAIETDTRAFVSPAGVKFGFGSSAAVAAAAWAALTALADGRPPSPAAVLAAVLEAHRAAQRGAGSGVDVAASCLGGVLEYRLEGRGRRRRLECRRVAWPERLRIVAIHTGEAASTPEFVRLVRELARRDRTAYRELMSALAELARAGCAAVQHGDMQALLATSRAYCGLMGELGRRSGADILSAAHLRVQALVEREGAAYKPSGAGGGDFGVALTEHEAVAARVRAAAAAAGLSAMDLVPDPRGVEVALPRPADERPEGVVGG